MEKVQNTFELSRVGQLKMCSQTVCQGGSFALESVAAFVWNGWQACYGISGRFGVEYADNEY